VYPLKHHKVILSDLSYFVSFISFRCLSNLIYFNLPLTVVYYLYKLHRDGDMKITNDERE